MSKQPETRYQDGDQLAADLRAVLDGQTGAPAMATGAMLAQPAAAAPVAAPAPATPASAEKTVIMGAAPPAALNLEATVPMSAVRPVAPPAALNLEATVPMSVKPAAPPAALNLEATVPMSAIPPASAPGYDASQKTKADPDSFAKTDVFRRPGPPDGGGDLEK